MQNTVCRIPEIVGLWLGMRKSRKHCDIGSKEPVLCYIHMEARTHTYFQGDTTKIYLKGKRKGKREERDIFLKLFPYFSFLDLIFLTHIITCFAFSLEEISQNVCNLYSRYICFGMLSVSFPSKENNFKNMFSVKNFKICLYRICIYYFCVFVQRHFHRGTHYFFTPPSPIMNLKTSLDF